MKHANWLHTQSQERERKQAGEWLSGRQTAVAFCTLKLLIGKKRGGDVN